jgi:hypothetical protein
VILDFSFEIFDWRLIRGFLKIKNQKSKINNLIIDLKDEGLRLWFQISDLKFEISNSEMRKTRPVNFSVCS